jgi:nodulation protein E
MFVLEPLEAAEARGATIYGEICGFGMSADACHITQPSAAGAARSMRAAIRDAGWVPEQIGYINAHGTATLANDVTEAAAIREVFGEHRPAVSSTKSMHGHALGAGGALEAAATVLGLYEGILPPTANYNSRDPEIDIDVIANEARHLQVDCAISNSFAFGGLNAVLAFRATKRQ